MTQPVKRKPRYEAKPLPFVEGAWFVQDIKKDVAVGAFYQRMPLSAKREAESLARRLNGREKGKGE